MLITYRLKEWDKNNKRFNAKVSITKNGNRITWLLDVNLVQGALSTHFASSSDAETIFNFLKYRRKLIKEIEIVNKGERKRIKV